MGRTQINLQHLILVMVDDGREISPELSQFARIELAEEDGELRVIASTFKMIEHLGSALVVGNVVGDDEVASRGHRVVTPG